MDFKSKYVAGIEKCLSTGNFGEALTLVTDNKHEQELKIACADAINAVAKYLTDDNFKEKPELFGTCEQILKEIAARANKEDVLFELLELLEGVKSDELLISLLKSLQVVLLRTNHKNSQVCLFRPFDKSFLKFIFRQSVGRWIPSGITFGKSSFHLMWSTNLVQRKNLYWRLMPRSIVFSCCISFSSSSSSPSRSLS